MPIFFVLFWSYGGIKSKISVSLPDRNESRIDCVMNVGLCEVSLMGACAFKAHSRGAASGERP